MPFIGKGEHLSVATTVAVSGDMPGGSMEVPIGLCQCLLHPLHLFGPIAVGSGKAPGEPAIGHFNLRAHHMHPLAKERAHPVADAGTHHQHAVAAQEGFVEFLHHGGAQQPLVGLCKRRAKAVELLQFHASKEMGKHPLLGFPVGIEPQLHQHQQGSIATESPQKAPPPAGKADEVEQGVAGGERSVEIGKEQPAGCS